MIDSLKIFARYTRRGASARLRVYQFIADFEAAGIEVSSVSLFDDRYLDTKYSRNARLSLRHVVAMYLAYLRALLSTDRRIALLITGELFPWIPGFVERFFLRGRRYALDYDDALFHRYDMHRSRLVRALLGRKIDILMAGADLVIAGNSYLADRSCQAGARVVEIVPTVVDTDRYPMAAFHNGDDKFLVGWIGTPITWDIYGRPLFEMLCERFADESVEFLAIGAAAAPRQSGNLRIVPWTEDSEAELIGTLSVGLMPLKDTPWERGKCAYKLIQYMACGVPVVASPVGANCEVVRDGKDGFLANTPEDWVTAIVTLLADRRRAKAMGVAGRTRVQELYSKAIVGPRLVALLNHSLQKDL